MEFEVTEQHLALLRRMYVEPLWDCAPQLDVKRPYGNSDVCGDVAAILGIHIEKDEGGWLTSAGKAVTDLMWKLHTEAGIALQIILFTGEFRAGKFFRPDRYDTRTWLRRES